MVDEAELVLVTDGPQRGRDAARPAQLWGRAGGVVRLIGASPPP